MRASSGKLVQVLTSKFASRGTDLTPLAARRKRGRRGMKGRREDGREQAVRRNNFPWSRNNRFAAVAAVVVVATTVAAAVAIVSTGVVVIAGHRDGRRRTAGEFRQVRRTTQEDSIRTPSRGSRSGAQSTSERERQREKKRKREKRSPFDKKNLIRASRFFTSAGREQWNR